MAAMATYMRAYWWNLTFLNGIYIEKKSKSGNSKLQSVLKICCLFGEGAQSAPLAWIGLKWCLGCSDVLCEWYVY